MQKDPQALGPKKYSRKTPQRPKTHFPQTVETPSGTATQYNNNITHYTFSLVELKQIGQAHKRI